MASTSVHFPRELLQRLDRLAARRGVSRNRLIVEACGHLLDEDRGHWPRGFFSNAHLDDDELSELRNSAEETLRDIVDARRSRVEPPF